MAVVEAASERAGGTVGSSGTATYTVATVDDDADEPDGSVTAGPGYTVAPGLNRTATWR